MRSYTINDDVVDAYTLAAGSNGHGEEVNGLCRRSSCWWNREPMVLRSDRAVIE